MFLPSTTLPFMTRSHMLKTRYLTGHIYQIHVVEMGLTRSAHQSSSSQNSRVFPEVNLATGRFTSGKTVEF